MALLKEKGLLEVKLNNPLMGTETSIMTIQQRKREWEG